MAVSVAGLTAKEAKEKRAEIIEKARADYDAKADAATDEDLAAFEEAMEDAHKLGEHAKRVSRLELAEQAQSDWEDKQREERGDGHSGGSLRIDPQAGTGREQNQQPTVMLRDGRNPDGSPRYIETAVGNRGAIDYRDAWSKYLSHGAVAAPLHIADEANQSGGPTKFMAVTSDNPRQAGFLISSEQFAASILRELDDELFIRQWAKIHTVLDSSSLGIRKRNTRANTFGWGPELKTQDPDKKLSYGKKVLTPHYATGAIQVSRDFLRRSAIGGESEVRSEISRDGGELMEDGYMLGDGQSKPLGVFVDSEDGISSARDVPTGAADGFTFDGLLNCKYSLKQRYRRGQRGPLRWLLSRTAINKVALIKDNEGQPIFRVGGGRRQDTRMPEDELLDYPVDESERCPNTFTSGQYVGLLANWNYYEIADALDMEIQVLYEIAARNNMVEYIARLKTDGMPTLEEAFARLVTN